MQMLQELFRPDPEKNIDDANDVVWDRVACPCAECEPHMQRMCSDALQAYTENRECTLNASVYNYVQLGRFLPKFLLSER